MQAAHAHHRAQILNAIPYAQTKGNAREEGAIWEDGAIASKAIATSVCVACSRVFGQVEEGLETWQTIDVGWQAAHRASRMQAAHACHQAQIVELRPKFLDAHVGAFEAWREGTALEAWHEGTAL